MSTTAASRKTSSLQRWFWNSRAGRRIKQSLFRLRGPESGEIELVQRRVFILPTRSGLLLGCMLIALLLGSINYSLSLGYVLTFMVASMAWIGMFHTFRNLAHLHLRGARVDAVFVGEIAEYRLVLRNPGKADRYAIQLSTPAELTRISDAVAADVAADIAADVAADIAANSETTLALPVIAQTRGWQTMPRIKLETVFPLGLWRAWSYWQPDLRALVYPQPAPPDTPLPVTLSDDGSGAGHAGPGSEDFAGIRPYAVGDTPRHLAWKAMARHPDGVALTKLFDGGTQRELWLDLASLPRHLGLEVALSHLTRWVIDCEAIDIRYGLRLPGVRLAPAHGAAHRQQCLTLLALYEN